jgi:hypothetical protein
LKSGRLSLCWKIFNYFIFPYKSIVSRYGQQTALCLWFKFVSVGRRQGWDIPYTNKLCAYARGVEDGFLLCFEGFSPGFIAARCTPSIESQYLGCPTFL